MCCSSPRLYSWSGAQELRILQSCFSKRLSRQPEFGFSGWRASACCRLYKITQISGCAIFLAPPIVHMALLCGDTPPATCCSAGTCLRPWCHTTHESSHSHAHVVNALRWICTTNTWTLTSMTHTTDGILSALLIVPCCTCCSNCIKTRLYTMV